MDKIVTLYMFWDPKAEMFSWNLPFLDRPILWYGFFFALGFFLGLLVFKNLLSRFGQTCGMAKMEQNRFIEKLGLTIFLSTLFGARLGEVLFYQTPSQYVHDPLYLFRFWEGGLASHGAIIGILIGLFIWSKRTHSRWPMFSWLRLVDLLVIPGLVAGAFIRIGNFFNQEIVGIPTQVSWGVIFGHPACGGPFVPRHPVQLYEAAGYLLLASTLWIFRTRFSYMQRLGKTAGAFFVGTFLFRFFIEFFKAKQSLLLETSAALDMGQWLSIPLVLLGAVLLCKQERLYSDPVEGEKG